MAIPFIFAMMRAVSTGTDFRFVWVALASTIAPVIVLAIPNRADAARTGRRLLALFAATAAAAGAGFAQGAHSTAAVLFVAIGFAICSAGGLALIGRTHQ